MVPPQDFSAPPSPNRAQRPPEPTTRVRGERRNFYDESFRVPHKFPIGSRVWMYSPQMRIYIGPLFVAEYAQYLQHYGPPQPQYILQPTIGPNQDLSKWAMCKERRLVACDSDQPPINPPP